LTVKSEQSPDDVTGRTHRKAR